PANEPSYTQAPFPDPAYRLLSLFRYWNVIQYYYPYKSLVGTPWPQTLEPLTDAFLNARNAAAYARALARMTAANNDSRTRLLPDAAAAVAGRYPVPFTVYIIDNKAVVTSISDSNALKGTAITPGVVIDEVDGVRLSDRIKYLSPYIPASSAGARLRDMQSLLLNSDKPDITLSCYTPEGRKFKAKFKRPDKVTPPADTLDTVPPARMLENNIGYIHYARLHPDNADSILQTMMKTKAIIFDLREPVTDTTVIYNVPSYLFTDRVPYAFVTAPYFPLPGTFHYQLASHGSDDNHYIGIKSNADHYPGKIVVLVDERTQDLAEWAAMLLQATKRAIVVGTPSAGAVGPVTRLPLADGHYVEFTAQGSYSLNGTVIQRRGITLTVPVTIHIGDIQQRRDVILRQALDFINNNP
ncbi:MAG TPA: S41 family peptidase, partial [Chitinophaga sp.]